MNVRLTISVLMCTFNGADYIKEQLESVLKQNRIPEEVVIIDDCSTDQTVKIIADFIKKHSLQENWKLYINSSNVGYMLNFKNGLSKVHGDIIMFCDQDDIWFCDKVSRTIDVLEKNKEIEVVGTDLIHFYQDRNEKIDGVFNKTVEHVSYSKRKKDFIYHPYGCTMAVRRTYINKIMPYYISTWVHDDFFWRFATVDGVSALIHDSFMKHRMSGTNVTSQHFYSARQRQRQAYRNKTNYHQLYEYCIQKKDYSIRSAKCIEYFWKGNELRYDFLIQPKIIKLINLIRFPLIYLSLKQFIGDVIFGFRDYYRKI